MKISLRLGVYKAISFNVDMVIDSTELHSLMALTFLQGHIVHKSENVLQNASSIWMKFSMLL